MIKVLLLTNEYPYNTGESFLDAEIANIPDDIDVEIVPIREMNNPVLERSVSEKVKVNSFLIKWNHSFTNRFFINKDLLIETIKEIHNLCKSGHISFNEIKRIIGYVFRAQYVAQQIENEYQEDLVNGRIAFYSYWFLHGALSASLLANKYSCQFVSRAHGVDVWDDVSAFHVIPLREYMLRSVEHLYVCGNAGKLFLQTKYPRFAEKIRCGYLGSEDYGWAPGDNRGDTFIIATCARMVPLKRIDLFVDALKEIDDYKITWIHFGDGPERKKIEQKVTTLCDNIHIDFPGNVKHDELMNFYSTHPVNLFVNTSNTEGVPVSIMEAISFGIPVIATDVGGTNEIVNADNGSLLHKEVSADSIASAIQEYIAMDSQRYVRKRECARKHWEECFSAKTNYGNFYKQFRG